MLHVYCDHLSFDMHIVVIETLSPILPFRHRTNLAVRFLLKAVAYSPCFSLIHLQAQDGTNEHRLLHEKLECRNNEYCPFAISVLQLSEETRSIQKLSYPLIGAQLNTHYDKVHSISIANKIFVHLF